MIAAADLYRIILGFPLELHPRCGAAWYLLNPTLGARTRCSPTPLMHLDLSHLPPPFPVPASRRRSHELPLSSCASAAVSDNNPNHHGNILTALDRDNVQRNQAACMSADGRCQQFTAIQVCLLPISLTLLLDTYSVSGCA